MTIREIALHLVMAIMIAALFWIVSGKADEQTYSDLADRLSTLETRLQNREPCCAAAFDPLPDRRT